MSSDIVYALRDFKAENQDELNFCSGEPIMILERDDKYLDGWWQGQNINGETGLFPKSYISPEKPAQKIYKEFLQPNQDKIKTFSVVDPPSFDNNPKQWTVQQVADWLGSVGLSSVTSNFIDQEITGDILLDLTIDTLKELDISTFGKRYKIMQAIETLKEDASLVIKPPTPQASVSTSAISTKKPRKPPVEKLSLSGKLYINDAPPTPIPSVSTPTPNSDSYKLSKEHTFEAPEHEGWLYKQSDKYKTWNKRWFVLKGPNLFYFKSPQDVRMKGIINLRGYKIIVDETIHAGKYCFKVQHGRERTFYFYTDTEDSMRVWINMLMKTTILRDYRAPVMSSNHMNTVPLEIARRMRPRPPSVIMYKNRHARELPKMPTYTEEEEDENLIDPHQGSMTSSVSSGEPKKDNYTEWINVS